MDFPSSSSTRNEVTKDAWPRVLARGVGYPLLAVVLYALSIGPVYYMAGGHSDAVDTMLEMIYAPLKQGLSGTPIEAPVAAVCRWWIAVPGGPKERWLRK